MSYLTGEILPPPALRFNYSSATAQHSNPRLGLRTYGPYDSSILGKDKINFAIICPQPLRGTGNSLLTGLTKGSGGFSGFQRLFRIPLNMASAKMIRQETEQEVRKAAQTLAGENPDIVLVLTCAGYLGHLFAKSGVEPVQWLSSAILLV